jgi:hypothetical protein
LLFSILFCCSLFSFFFIFLSSFQFRFFIAWNFPLSYKHGKTSTCRWINAWFPSWSSFYTAITLIIVHDWIPNLLILIMLQLFRNNVNSGMSHYEWLSSYKLFE